MAYKRNVDRLPIVPPDAEERNVVCHFCIVGCGYKAYVWDANREGGPRPDQNKFGVDLTRQQEANTAAWYAPSMYNIVKKDGRDVHIVIKPDPDCVVNKGLGSIRGAKLGEYCYSAITGTQTNRLTDPLVWRYGQMQPTSWDDALDLVARVTARVIKEYGWDGVFVSAYDHGGAGGGYENNWAIGKLYFQSMQVTNIRIHNRPAYNSEVHASRDMGVGELNNAYEDAELADTIVAVGTNPLETQTNYFLAHWIPNLRGETLDKKKRLMPDEPHEPARIIFIDPRRTVSVNAAEAEAGKDRVLHLAIESGTDLVLFNALLTYIFDQGWIDREFIEQHTVGFEQGPQEVPMYPARADSGEFAERWPGLDEVIREIRTSPEEAARICGVSADDIVKAARWIAEPKAGGHRRRTMFGYEKGIIWGNDNYRTIAALVNLALATGNIGRMGGGCCRMGGHQEGYVRPPYPGGRPAPYIDKLLIEGKGAVHHIWGCDHYKTTLNATEFKRVYKKRTDMVKDAMNAVGWADRERLVEAIMWAIRQGGLFAVDVDIKPTMIGEACHVVLPAATQGEMNLTSMNGERRMRLSEKYMDPPGQALPDCLIIARLANHLERVFREMGDDTMADRFKGYDWKSEEDAFMDGYHKHAPGGQYVTYERLRKMGTNGFQEPAQGVDEEGRIIGTPRLYTDGKFSTPDGKARFMITRWRGLQAPGKKEQKRRYRFLINNGRANHVWQSWYYDVDHPLVMDRWPWPFLEMNPDDMKELGLKAGDLVEVYNDAGWTQAMVYPTPTARRGETFMLFAAPRGVQGNVVNDGVNELVIPNYKQTWANIRKLADAPAEVAKISFKSKEYKAPA